MQLAFEFECIRTRNTHVAQQKQGYHHESAASYPGPCTERVLRMGLGMSLVCEQPILLQVIKNIKNVSGCRDTRTAKSKETRGMIEHNSEVYNHPYRDLLSYIHVQ